MERTILNKKQLSNYLGMSIGKIDHLIKEDKIGYYKIGKNVRFNMNEINEWLLKFRNLKFQ